MGKTTLVEALREYFRIYYSAGSKWFDGYDDEHHELMVFDEFNGAVPMAIMNRVLDGQHCTLEVKGAQISKNRNLPVIILTNYTRDELYTGERVNESVRQAFLSRCLYLRLEQGDEPWRLLPYFNDFEPEREAESPAPTSDDTLSAPDFYDCQPTLNDQGGIAFDSSFYIDGGSFGYGATDY